MFALNTSRAFAYHSVDDALRSFASPRGDCLDGCKGDARIILTDVELLSRARTDQKETMAAANVAINIIRSLPNVSNATARMQDVVDARCMNRIGFETAGLEIVQPWDGKAKPRGIGGLGGLAREPTKLDQHRLAVRLSDFAALISSTLEEARDCFATPLTLDELLELEVAVDGTCTGGCAGDVSSLLVDFEEEMQGYDGSTVKVLLSRIGACRAAAMPTSGDRVDYRGGFKVRPPGVRLRTFAKPSTIDEGTTIVFGVHVDRRSMCR
jgi:hypothetical protein